MIQGQRQRLQEHHISGTAENVKEESFGPAIRLKDVGLRASFVLRGVIMKLDLYAPKLHFVCLVQLSNLL